MATVHAKAQCASSLQTTSYNIYLTGSGNNRWGFSMPQFDPSVGTLVAVDIRSVVSVYAIFQLSNTGIVQDTYNLMAGRNDSISVTALASPITNNYSRNYGPYNLLPGQDTVGAGTNLYPEQFSLLSHYAINDSVTSSVVGFLGSGYVTFAYIPNSYLQVTSGSNDYISNSFSDTMNITLTYYYCQQNLLAEDITFFSVTKKQGTLVNIAWQTENETPGKKYDIEESGDEKVFKDITSLTSVVKSNGSGNYNYNYLTSPGATGKLYFRLKETNANGYVKFSEIREIEMGSSNGIYLFPNPARSFINIANTGLGNGGWTADIFSAEGSLVQSNYLDNVSPAHINFIRHLAKGAYFVRLTSKQGYAAQTLPFIVY
jgi:type IX secretion system substrate protein